MHVWRRTRGRSFKAYSARSRCSPVFTLHRISCCPSCWRWCSSCCSNLWSDYWSGSTCQGQPGRWLRLPCCFRSSSALACCSPAQQHNGCPNYPRPGRSCSRNSLLLRDPIEHVQRTLDQMGIGLSSPKSLLSNPIGMATGSWRDKHCSCPSAGDTSRPVLPPRLRRGFLAPTCRGVAEIRRQAGGGGDLASR